MQIVIIIRDFPGFLCCVTFFTNFAQNCIFSVFTESFISSSLPHFSFCTAPLFLLTVCKLRTINFNDVDDDEDDDEQASDPPRLALSQCHVPRHHLMTARSLWPLRARGTSCRHHFVALIPLTLSKSNWKHFSLPRHVTSLIFSAAAAALCGLWRYISGGL